MNEGFDRVYNLYNLAVYFNGDIIGPMAYRTGLAYARHGLSAAAGRQI